MNSPAEMPGSEVPAGPVPLWSDRLDVDSARAQPAPEAQGPSNEGLVRIASLVERVLSLPLSGMLVAGSPDTLANGAVAGSRLADRWSFYADPRFREDPSTFFATPPAPTDVEISPTRHLLATPGRGTVVDIRFPSKFVPANPDLRDQYSADVRNRTVHARWWRHEGGPRPTIVCIHGFQAGSHIINVEFFDVRSLYVDGYDVVLFQLPYHGARATLFEGWSYLSLDVAHLAEVVAHSISDVRALISHLIDEGVPAVGVKGVSLGGYLTALLAGVDDRIAFAIPVAGPASMPDFVSDLFPLGAVLPKLLSAIGWTEDDLRVHMACHTPLQHTPRIDPERLLVVAAAGDNLVRPYHARLLSEHWDGAPIVWRPGSHQVHLDRGAYRDLIRGFLGRIGFH